MSIKAAAIIFLLAIAFMIAVISVGVQVLSPEYFGEMGVLRTRYKYAFDWFVFILFTLPLLMLTLALFSAGAKFSLKKATLVLIVSMATLLIGITIARSVLPQEFLTDYGLKAALYKITGVIFVSLFCIAPMLIFFNALVNAGRDSKAKNYQGMFNLHLKVGPRWLMAIYGGAGVVLVVYMIVNVTVIPKFSGSSVILLAFLLAGAALLMGSIWSAIHAAVLRVQYDDKRITAMILLFRQREHSWNDLSEIKGVYSSDGTRLIFRNTGTVHIHEYLEGFDDLMKHANKVLKDA